MTPTFPQKKVGVIPKEGRAGAASRAHPSFGMTTTQDIRDLFAWRAPNEGHDLMLHQNRGLGVTENITKVKVRTGEVREPHRGGQGEHEKQGV